MISEVTEQSKAAEALPSLPQEPNLKWLTGGILSTKFPQREWINHKPSIMQAKILLHIYKNEGVSLKELRSIFNLTKITSYRHLGLLKRIGSVKWKGSHKAGGYIMTEEGKEFVKTEGNADKLEYYRKKSEERHLKKINSQTNSPG
jgi:predicted HTH transcriptional regulator